MVVMADLASPSRAIMSTPASASLASQLSAQANESEAALRRQQQQEQHELLQQLQASFEAFRAEREAADTANRQVLFSKKIPLAHNASCVCLYHQDLEAMRVTAAALRDDKALLTARVDQLSSTYVDLQRSFATLQGEERTLRERAAKYAG
jgi:5-formyltetrahydrofolate cyclo-ligase